MAKTTCDVIVEALLDWGADTVFGLPGDGINGFMEALRKAKDRMRYVHVRHEETAAMAACAYAKFSGRLGVCFSTAGPGALHLLNGLYDAKIDGAPVVAITGMTYHDLIGTHYLQDINQDYLFQDVARFNQRVMGVAHAPNVIDLACRTALSERAVAHLCIPIDVQVQPCGEDYRSKRNLPHHTSRAFEVPKRVPERSQLEQAAAALQGKTKVAILVGSGARGCRTEIEMLAERLGAPVVKALLGKEVIPDDSPYCVGGTGVVGARPSSDVFSACDALVIVGSSFPYIEFLPKPGQCVAVQVDDRPDRIGLRHPVDVGLVGDAQATLRELLTLLRRNDDRSFLSKAQEGVRDWWSLMEERGTRPDVPMKPQVVTWALSQLLAEDAIVCGDSGTVTTWAARMRLRGDQRFSFSGTLCSMAAGLPYAIGAQAAFPKRQVVAITGDGSMSMAMGDLATLVQQKLPAKIIVFRNDALGLIRWEQMVFLGNPEYGIELQPIDFVKVAEGCGLRALRVTEPSACRATLKAALETEGPVLVECVVDPNEPPLPPKITREQARHLGEALARGEVNRTPIGLTIGRDAIDESTFAASPMGVVGRLKKSLHIGGREGGNGNGRNEK